MSKACGHRVFQIMFYILVLRYPEQFLSQIQFFFSERGIILTFLVNKKPLTIKKFWNSPRRILIGNSNQQNCPLSFIFLEYWQFRWPKRYTKMLSRGNLRFRNPLVLESSWCFSLTKILSFIQRFLHAIIFCVLDLIPMIFCNVFTYFLRCLKSLVTKMTGILMADFKGGLISEFIFILVPQKSAKPLFFTFSYRVIHGKVS